MVRRKKHDEPLTISLNGFIVGKLLRDKLGVLHYTYEPSWLEQQGSRPISLSLPLRAKAYSGQLVQNFFDNLLPDNQKVRERLQERFKTSTTQAYDLLSEIGIDCVGAIQISQGAPSNVKTLNFTKLTKAKVAQNLRGYRGGTFAVDNALEEFRISIAGAQEKTAFLRVGKSWAKPKGVTATSHIFKLPLGVIAGGKIDLSHSCENEFICMKLAKAFGLDTAEVNIETFEDQTALIVTRFDRKYSEDKSWLMRLPQEDFCQAHGLSSGRKYQSDGGLGIQQCIDLLRTSEDSNDRVKFFGAQILFWLLAAPDGHAKNFSIFLLAFNRIKMTPLYDIISAYPVMSKGGLQRQKLKMAMSLKGKNVHWHWAEIVPRHFISTAKHAGFDSNLVKTELNRILDSVELAINEVENLIPNSFPEYVANAIFSGIRKKRDKLSHAKSA